MKTQLNKQQKTLMTLSLGLWFLSLLLPTFYYLVDERYLPITGFQLLLSLPLALVFLPAGLALFAHFLYWWIYRQLKRGEKPFIAVWLMLMLASSILTVNHSGDPYVSINLRADLWGYGAFVWGLSIILMAGAVWDQREYSTPTATLAPYLIPFAVLMLILSGIKAYQWSRANHDERALYIPFLAAYGASFTPTGIPYNPPPKALQNRDKVPLEVVGELMFENEHFYLKAKEDYNLPLPILFLYGGYRVDQIDERYVIKPSNEQAYYRYRVPYAGDDKITLVLEDVSENREIWRSDNFFLKKHGRPLSNHVTEPYPDFKSDIVKLFEQQEKVEQKKEKEQWSRWKPLLLPLPMRFDTRCPSKALPSFWQAFEYSKNFISVDDFLVQFKESSYQDRIGFNDVFWCHEDWVLTVDAQTNTENPHEFVLSAEILNRSDLSHIDEYDKEHHRHFRELYYKLDYSKMAAEDASALLDLHHRYGVHALELGLRAVDFDLTQLRLHFDFGEIILKAKPLMMNEKD